MTREEIALIIKRARTDAGFTQKEAASAIGRKQQTLASWETGQSQPDANTLFQLFDFYGISVDDAFHLKKHNDTPAPPIGEAGALTAQELSRISAAMAQMNEEGRERAVELVEDLAAGGRYKKTSADSLDKEA